ncbi:hypothetical protein NDR87_08650 [Nocardia sp. CDC159]|uniref:3-oxoacyl-[acyl-carrier-protein] synthase-3 n=1 Tax=Nocardia pulmonis TaxID=2951408 RepID=A0A9X2E3N3_9NOCA|nr:MULTISPECIES: hypothetical protein [Nocardia]MCM6773537.1 hypothetical protein [Nocardia pulmonis]MCM6786424.1 hypothetical protein [Nocardia sp. CDC159]
MSATIVSAAACADPDTGSYFDLATRAGRACLARAALTPDQIGLVLNAGVFRDQNISEPAVAALVQKRLEVGLEYRTGDIPAFSFDLMNGGTGMVHALMAAQCFLELGDIEYALVLSGDAHPSTERGVDGFPYTATGAAMVLRSDPDSGGFGELQQVSAECPRPAAWVDLAAAGTEGRRAVTVRPGGDPLSAAAEVVTRCLAEEHLELTPTGALLLAPAPATDFASRLAKRLGAPPDAIAGVDPALGDPYTAAPVHAYLAAQAAGLVDDTRPVLFLAVDGDVAACITYRPCPIAPVGIDANLCAKQLDM